MGKLSESEFTERLEIVSKKLENCNDRDSLKTVFIELRSLLVENFEITRYSVFYENIEQGIYRFVYSDKLDDAKAMIKHLINSLYENGFQARRVYFNVLNYDLVCHIENLKSAFEINVIQFEIKHKMELALESLLFINKNIADLKANIHLSNSLTFAIKDSRYYLEYDKKILNKARAEIDSCYNQLVDLFYNK